MNAGLMADLPSLDSSGAEGVGLFRTELRFLFAIKCQKVRNKRNVQKGVDAAGGKTVVFRTLDIGSDKVLPYMPNVEEPNPALGWRAIRVGFDKPGVLRMQLQAIACGGGAAIISYVPLLLKRVNLISQNVKWKKLKSEN